MDFGGDDLREDATIINKEIFGAVREENPGSTYQKGKKGGEFGADLMDGSVNRRKKQLTVADSESKKFGVA